MTYQQFATFERMRSLIKALKKENKTLKDQLGLNKPKTVETKEETIAEFESKIPKKSVEKQEEEVKFPWKSLDFYA